MSLEGLTYNEVDGRSTPRLAERLEWVNEGRALHVYLRPNVKFHDGTPLTAEVAANLLRRAAGDVNVRAQLPSFSRISQMRAGGELQLIIDLLEPAAFLPEELSYLLAHGGEYVGTGPYRSVKADRNELSFDRFDLYYRGTPSVNRVTVRQFDSFRTAWSSLLRGDVDMVSDVPPDAVEFIRTDDVQIISFARGFQYLIAFNANRPQFKSAAIRRALNLAVDRDALVANVLRGYGIGATGPLWPKHWAYDTSLEGYRFDPSEATALLDEHGFHQTRIAASQSRPAARLQFTCLLPSGYPVLERIALHVQKQLYDIGVDMQFEALPLTEFSKRIGSGAFDAVLNEQISGPTLGRPYSFWRSPSGTGGLYNFFGYQNDETDRLFDVLSTSLNDAAIRSTMSQLQRVLLQDPPAIFLAWNQRLRAVRQGPIQIVREFERDPLLTLWRWTADNENRAPAAP